MFNRRNICVFEENDRKYFIGVNMNYIDFIDYIF